jgi:hypothetical protein
VGHAIRDALSSKTGGAKIDNQDKMRFAKFLPTEKVLSVKNDEVTRERFPQTTTIDEIMAMSPLDFERIENGASVERSPSTTCSPVPTADERQEADERLVETSLSTSTVGAAKPQGGNSIVHLPMPVTRQRSDQFSPIKLEDMHNLDMSLFHAYLAQVAETFPCLNDKPKRDGIDFQKPFNSEVDTEEINADAEFASFVIDALSDDDDNQSADTCFV